MTLADLAAVRELPTRPSTHWMAHAACRGLTHLFFGPRAERPQARARREARARARCLTCPVLLECRRYAREHHEYGYWGAESEEERAAAGYAVPNPLGGRRARDVTVVVRPGSTLHTS